MGISLAHSGLSLEDRMSIIHGRVIREIANPPRISKRDLFRKVKIAAQAIGIRDVVVHEWDYELLIAWFTNGVLRERKYIQGDMRMDGSKDIGYFIKNRLATQPLYTVKSFEINAFVFSDRAYNEFHKELERQGLKPAQHNPLGPIFVEESEVRAWQNRTPLYQ